MSEAPLYRWSVTDHRMGRTIKGEALKSPDAKAAVVTQLRQINRPGMRGVAATVYRPSGGGWFARARGDFGIDWEAWEQERV